MWLSKKDDSDDIVIVAVVCDKPNITKSAVAADLSVAAGCQIERWPWNDNIGYTQVIDSNAFSH
jgi:hypothetical protein